MSRVFFSFNLLRFLFRRQNILEDIVKYPNSNRDEMVALIAPLKKKISFTDPAHCYDEICRTTIKFERIKLENDVCFFINLIFLVIH